MLGENAPEIIQKVLKSVKRYPYLIKGFLPIAIILRLLCLFTPAASAFTIPERLVYDLTWTGVKAGTATLEFTGSGNSSKIISTARSASWVSVFYTVDDRIESTLTAPDSSSPIGLPMNYRVKVREGRHRRDKEVVFRHDIRQARYIDHLGGDNDNYDIHENTFDPLSSFFFVRKARIEVGKSIFVNVFDSKKLWNVEVQVLRREKIETKLGSFNTIVIKPLMKSEGIFNRKGDILIWLTDDAKRIPVKIETQVKIGYITATLVGGTY